MHWRDPFRVRGFRFQWPADLATSWAFEMESIVLGWFILVDSGSVMMLVVFGSLQYLGSWVSPLFGVVGDRLGYRRMLVLSRALYAALAATFMLLAWVEALTPLIVLFMAALAGLVRPSDMMMRNALIAQTLPPRHLLGTLGISRITSDSARIAGALAGAGVVAWLGMTWAYALITVLYTLSFVLSRGVSDGPAQTTDRDAPRVSPVRDLQLAFGYVWDASSADGGHGLGVLGQPAGLSLLFGFAALCRKKHLPDRPDGAGLAGRQLRLWGPGGLGGAQFAPLCVSRRANHGAGGSGVVCGGCAVCFQYPSVRGHGLAVFGRSRAKPQHDALGGRDAARHRACLPGPCDGHAHAGHLGLAFGLAALGPLH